MQSLQRLVFVLLKKKPNDVSGHEHARLSQCCLAQILTLHI